MLGYQRGGMEFLLLLFMLILCFKQKKFFKYLKVSFKNMIYQQILKKILTWGAFKSGVIECRGQ